MRVGHKLNSGLNREWAGHVRRAGKKWTNKLRRNLQKRIIKREKDE